MRYANHFHFAPTALASLTLAACVLVPLPADAGVRDALASSPTFEMVSRLLDSSPTGCTQGIQRRVCTWRISENGATRVDLVSERAGPGPLHVVCDFAAVRATRAARDSRCSIHEPAVPRNRTRRQPWTLANPEDAALALEQAQTLAQLSHTFGSSPENCLQRDDSEWICAWVARSREPGHALLGALAKTAGAARLVCRLPLEGGNREADSCRAQELD